MDKAQLRQAAKIGRRGGLVDKPQGLGSGREMKETCTRRNVSRTGCTYASPSSPPSSESESVRLPLRLRGLRRLESLLMLRRAGSGDTDGPLLSSPDSSSEPASASRSSTTSAIALEVETDGSIDAR